MIKLPGFIDIGTDIYQGNWRQTTQMAVASGYTTILAQVTPADELCGEREAFAEFIHEPMREALCDVVCLPVLTPLNIRSLEEWIDLVPSAVLDLSILAEVGSYSQMTLLGRLFRRWPEDKPICVRGDDNQIGTALFMGQANGKKVHICAVSTRSQIEMIREAKASGLRVSCGIHPLSLVLSSSQPQAAKILKNPGSEDDRLALWTYKNDIDCFSTDGIHPDREQDRFSIMLPVMSGMLQTGMLTAQDVIDKCCKNPAEIFRIPVDAETWFEMEEPSLSAQGELQCRINSVTLRGKTVYTAEERPKAEVPPENRRIHLKKRETEE